MFFKTSVNSFLKKYSFSSKMIVDEIMYDYTLPKPKEAGCDIIQGYYFSKPLPPEEFEQYRKNGAE